jgi:spermidine synthase
MGWFFIFFFVSGFCSILYEIVWLRLAMAQFGVTSALVSIVLSTFMAGLGVGSWLSGRLIRKYGGRLSIPALRLYALTELLIGLSALLVPYELLWGRMLLERTGLSSSWAYYLISGAWLALTLVPWCAFMGATIPVGMLAIRNGFRNESPRAFSFLYLSNVLGAMTGATLPLLLIELRGFHNTLKIGAALNTLIALSALALRLPAAEVSVQRAADLSATTSRNLQSSSQRPLLLLFATGLTSMGMEVVWIRQLTPYLGTMVYAFASILGLYLAATFLGSLIYRRWSGKRAQEGVLAWALLGLSAFLPLLAANPELHLSKVLRLAIGLVPFSGILGFVTPMLVDRWSQGDPDRAGRAYAVNVLGCILGPLVSGFVLLPLLSERWVLFVFALPWLALGMRPGWSSTSEHASAVPTWKRITSYASVSVATALLFTSKAFEDQFAGREVLRDNTATIVVTGDGLGRTGKRLFVNGVGITHLTPVTKIMAHLPLSSLDHPPQSALVVCFGMGTTFRSLSSWGIPVTAVELVPSVPQVFGYFHEDGPALLRSPLSHVVIDDGRRYLETVRQQYDVITIDPPPPVSAAGSSLLYSEEFYTIVKQRLAPGGILQQWLPSGDEVDRASVARALKQSFPYVRAFRSVEGWGFHFLASSYPIPLRNAAELVSRMPAPAIKDMMEWGPEPSPERQLAVVLNSEFSPDAMIAEAPGASALKDDRPANEYFLIRHLISSINKKRSHLTPDRGH